METYFKYIENMPQIAKVFDDLTFMRYFLPFIILAGFCSALIFGLIGLIKQKTFVFIRPSDTGGLAGNRGWWITGVWAIAFGVLYLFVALIVGLFAGPLVLALIGLI